MTLPPDPRATCRSIRFELARRALEAGYSRAARSIAADLEEEADEALATDACDVLARVDRERASRWLRWLDDDVRRAR